MNVESIPYVESFGLQGGWSRAFGLGWRREAIEELGELRFSKGEPGGECDEPWCELGSVATKEGTRRGESGRSVHRMREANVEEEEDDEVGR